MPKNAKKPGYYSDECQGMWQVVIADETYHFNCGARHPLRALEVFLKHPLIAEVGLEHIDDEPDEAWSIHMMAADEKFGCHTDGEAAIGPLQMDEDSCWEGTAKEAADLCTQDCEIMISTAWAY